MKKGLLKALEAVVSLLFVNPELLVIPVIMIIVGRVCSFGWKYYVFGFVIYGAAIWIGNLLIEWTSKSYVEWLFKKLKKPSDPDSE